MSYSKHTAKNSFKCVLETGSEIFDDFMENVLNNSKSHGSKTILDNEGLIEKILKDITKTADYVKYNIERSVVDYTSAPQKEVIETDEDIIIYLELPNVQKDNIQLNISETKLKIKANFKIKQEIKDGNGISMNDTKRGVFKRSFNFPKKVIPKKAEATFENNVLQVEVPKVDKKESYTVDIQ
jgi:HSP20 family protein